LPSTKYSFEVSNWAVCRAGTMSLVWSKAMTTIASGLVASAAVTAEGMTSSDAGSNSSPGLP
jgi:hypothetical protein